MKSRLKDSTAETAAGAVKALVSLQDITKTYRDGNVRALAGVTLDLLAGQFVSITGPSGCGKSTLLHLIGGLDQPTSGSIHFRGQPLTAGTDLDRLRSQEIGFVFQSFHLLPNLTARENVQLPLFGGGRTDAFRVARADDLLIQVGLAERAGHLPGELSIGQRQRVAIARALANDPAVVLADEPTGSLDSASGTEVMDLLCGLHADRGLTLVIVTHDPAIAARADRTIEMLDGQVIRDTAISPCPTGGSA
jgi:putative ABC transport system ATP-binding protein